MRVSKAQVQALAAGDAWLEKDGGGGAFDGLGCPQVFPVLCREVVENEQRVSILAQAVGRLLVFQRVAFDGLVMDTPR